ncbi:MAG: penicillin-binding protein activator, partial [Bdellovibrionia bacterium]
HDPQVLEALLKEHERSPFADLLLYRLSLKLRGRGQSAQAQPYLEALVRNFPKSPFYADALKQLTAPPAASPSSSTVIGVLLPTTGKLAKYGAKSLQGIELAFELFNSTAKDSRFQLVIEDSGEDPETALLALERLVNEHQVSAVIGPLLSKGAERVAQKAQDFRIPLISLARKTTPPNDFVFQSGLTQQLQAAEIARHALESLKLKRFAILYPDDKMGLEQAHAFWDAVESQGGQVMAIESYPPGETDFRKPVDRLVGLHYLDARQRELDALAQQREANGIKKRTRKTEQFYDLKPIVDFEAVFIPDEPKVAGQIFPTFSYRDVDQMKFLGTSSWNSPDFLNRVQNYGELCSWVDSFSQGSTLASLSSFKDLYQATFHQEPTSLEATAYDAALILKSTLEDSSPGVSPEELKGKLMKVKNFPGVSGPITYQSGQYKRPLLFLTIQNGHFTEFRPELTQKENSR